MHSSSSQPNPTRHRSSYLVNVQEIFNFENERPPRNGDVLRFIVSRLSVLGKDRLSGGQAIFRAMLPIKNIWRSLGFGIEDNFLSNRCLVKRIGDVHWAYLDVSKNPGQLPKSDVLAFVQKTCSDYDRFMAEVFFPFRVNDYESFRMKKKKKKGNKKSVHSSPLNCDLKQKIRPSVVSIPCLNNIFDGDISKWLKDTSGDHEHLMDSAMEDTDLESEVAFAPEGVEKVLQHPYSQSIVCDRSSQTD